MTPELTKSAVELIIEEEEIDISDDEKEPEIKVPNKEWKYKLNKSEVMALSKANLLESDAILIDNRVYENPVEGGPMIKKIVTDEEGENEININDLEPGKKGDENNQDVDENFNVAKQEMTGNNILKTVGDITDKDGEDEYTYIKHEECIWKVALDSTVDTLEKTFKSQIRRKNFRIIMEDPEYTLHHYGVTHGEYLIKCSDDVHSNINNNVPGEQRFFFV